MTARSPGAGPCAPAERRGQDLHGDGRHVAAWRRQFPPGGVRDEDWVKSQHPSVRAGPILNRRTVGRAVNRLFQVRLTAATANFDDVTWLGLPVWQSVMDLWTIQEEISRIKPALLIETGTYRGGSALSYASLMHLMGHGHLFTIDGTAMHAPSHPRVTFHLGSSTAAETVAAAQAAVDHHGGPCHGHIGQRPPSWPRGGRTRGVLEDGDSRKSPVGKGRCNRSALGGSPGSPRSTSRHSGVLEAASRVRT
jgi:hypothetical protein